jgi:hypothetical protein
MRLGLVHINMGPMSRPERVLTDRNGRSGRLPGLGSAVVSQHPAEHPGQLVAFAG